MCKDLGLSLFALVALAVSTPTQAGGGKKDSAPMDFDRSWVVWKLSLKDFTNKSDQIIRRNLTEKEARALAEVAALALVTLVRSVYRWRKDC
jgi:hypothetical protein